MPSITNHPMVSSITSHPVVISSAAASTAMIVPYYGFMSKSALQLGQPRPPFNFKAVAISSFKGVPLIGGIAGFQVFAQRNLEASFSQKSTLSNVASSAAVAAVSTPLLAVFNGLTMGNSLTQSLKNFSTKQGAAIFSREMIFLASLGMTKPVSAFVKTHISDNAIVDYSSSFFTGFAGALLNHPADTVNTVFQDTRLKNSKAPLSFRQFTFQQLLKGSAMRAVSTGTFYLLFRVAEEAMQNLNKDSSKTA